MNVITPNVDLQIPMVASSIRLTARQSKVIVTNYAFGECSRMLYSTAQILYAGVIDGRDVLFLHGDSSQEHEAAIGLSGKPSMLRQNPHPLVSFSNDCPVPDNTIVSFLPGVDGLITIWDSDTQLVLFADSETAATFWSPVIAEDATNPLRNFWGIGTTSSILIGGPYLVRSAEISGSHLALRGDLKTGVRLVAIVPRSVTSVTWNGALLSGDVAASNMLTSIGGFVGELHMKTASVVEISVPKLGDWKFKDSLPEIRGEFDDAGWVVANKTSTNIPFKPYYGDGRVLYGCDYGLCVFVLGYHRFSNLGVRPSCENIVLWRGHFQATGVERSVSLAINGGQGR